MYLYKTIDYVKGTDAYSTAVQFLYTEESTNLLHLIVALYIIHYRTERYMDDNMTWFTSYMS